MNDMTGAETIAGQVVLIELDEANRVIMFRDEDNALIAEYSLETFASVTESLALNIGAGIVLDADTVAGVQQWARLDLPA